MECNEISMKVACRSHTHLEQKNKPRLVTIVLVSSRRKEWLHVQTSLFIQDKHHFLVMVAPPISWPSRLPDECLHVRSPQPARGPKSGGPSRESSGTSATRVPLRVPLKSPLAGTNIIWGFAVESSHFVSTLGAVSAP